MIAWFAKNDIAANLLMMCILFAGSWSLLNKIPQEVFPNLEENKIEIIVPFRAAIPNDVELKVTAHVEEAIFDLEGIKEISSKSIEGYSHVIVTLSGDSDEEELLQQIKYRVDAINTFPAEIENPIIQKMSERSEVISVVIFGDKPEIDIRSTAEEIKRELSYIKGMGTVKFSLSKQYEISVSISKDKLQQYQLTLEDVANSIRENAQDMSAGTIKTSGGDILIRSRGQAYTGDALADIIIKHQVSGATIPLRQLANINDGFEESVIHTRFNGQTAVFLDVFRNDKQNAVTLGKIIKQYIDEKQPLMPSGIHLNYWNDQSQIIVNRFESLAMSAFFGSILVFLILTLFLRPAVAFWVFIGIPISFIGAFLFMPFFGVTLNIVSLFGFILVLGLVVDDAIITGENVYSHLEDAESGLQAAISGTRQISLPVMLGVLTTIIAFIPFMFVGGSQGKLLLQIPAVAIPILIISLIESKLVLPSRLKFVRLRKNVKPDSMLAFQQRFADGFERAILTYYRPALQWCMNHKASTLIVFNGTLLIIISILFTGANKFTFFPTITSDQVKATLTMPIGTPFERLDSQVNLLSEKAYYLQEKYTDPDTQQSIIKNIVSLSGASNKKDASAHHGQVSFDLVPEEQHDFDITSLELEQEWRSLIGPILGAESLVFDSQAAYTQKAIDIRLKGDDFALLQQVSQEIKVELRGYRYIQDVSDNLSNGKQQLFIELKPLAKTLGLTRVNLVSQVRHAFWGIEVERVLRGQQDVRIMVRLPIEERQSLTDLESFLIAVPGDKLVPFSQLATMSLEKSPEVIHHINRHRTVDVTADLAQEDINFTALDNTLSEYLSALKEKYPSVDFSLEGETSELKETFASLKWSVLAALFVIYAILAIPFKSYSIPVIVMSAIPFSLIGAIAGHLLLNINLTIMSILGMMALWGVVVNDALVVVNCIRKREVRNIELNLAVANVAQSRFRPIMLTSVTTFLGLLPIIFDQSTQAEFLIPMAVSISFGILFAPLINLFLLPILYLVIADIKRRGTFAFLREPTPS